MEATGLLNIPTSQNLIKKRKQKQSRMIVSLSNSREEVKQTKNNENISSHSKNLQNINIQANPWHEKKEMGVL
jgi:hypothetical protein